MKRNLSTLVRRAAIILWLATVFVAVIGGMVSRDVPRSRVQIAEAAELSIIIEVGQR